MVAVFFGDGLGPWLLRDLQPGLSEESRSVRSKRGGGLLGGLAPCGHAIDFS